MRCNCSLRACLPLHKFGALLGSSSMAAVVELPVQLYRDACRGESLLLDAYRTLIERQQGPSVPPPLSMTPLNDLCLFAKETLTIENWNVFAAYAKDLSEVLPAPSHISLPWPIEDAQGLCTASNRYAMAVLEERTGTLWTAVRLVVAHMEFQPEARRQAVRTTAWAASRCKWSPSLLRACSADCHPSFGLRPPECADPLGPA